MKTLLTICFVLWLYPNVNAQSSLAEYGLKGNVRHIAEASYGNNQGKREFLYKWEYEYDKYGNLVHSVVVYNNGHSSIMNYKYKYNSNGCMTEMTQDRCRTLFTYDKNRRLREAKRYPVKGKELLQRTVYTYDTKGNCTREVNYQGNGGFISSTSRKFDDHNRLIWKVIDSTIIVMMKGSKNTYKYNENGIVTEYTIYEPGMGGSSERMVNYIDTRLDDKGNWIKRTEMLINDKRTDTVISEREIVYY